MIDLQPYIPLVLMGATTQLFLSLMVPSLLYLRYKHLNRTLNDFNALATIAVLATTIILSFACLYCIIAAIIIQDNE
jgi:amino acid transporter